MDRELINYLPEYLREIREYKAILSAEQVIFEDGWACAEYALQESFILTATDYGLSRWEKMLKIEPRGDESLDERRFRILAMITSQLPYTYRQLENMLMSLCGAGKYRIELKPDEYSIKVSVEMTSKNNYQAVVDLLGQVIPANLVLNTGLYVETIKTVYVAAAVSSSKHYELLA